MKRKYAVLLSAFLMIGCLILMTGISYARYQTQTRADYILAIKKPADFQIIQNLPWTQEGELQRYSFSVMNQGQESDSWFTLRFAATAGMESDKALFRLITKNTSGMEWACEAEVSPFAEDSLLFQELGQGQEYRFLDETGKELVWKLDSSMISGQQFILEVEGAKTSSLIRILLTETKPDQK